MKLSKRKIDRCIKISTRDNNFKEYSHNHGVIPSLPRKFYYTTAPLPIEPSYYCHRYITLHVPHSSQNHTSRAILQYAHFREWLSIPSQTVQQRYSTRHSYNLHSCFCALATLAKSRHNSIAVWRALRKPGTPRVRARGIKERSCREESNRRYLIASRATLETAFLSLC